jgi:hypothetical protein
LKFLRFLFSGSISSPCFKLRFQLCVHHFTKALSKAPSSPAGHKKRKRKKKRKAKGVPKEEMEEAGDRKKMIKKNKWLKDLGG